MPQKEDSKKVEANIIIDWGGGGNRSWRMLEGECWQLKEKDSGEGRH